MSAMVFPVDHMHYLLNAAIAYDCEHYSKLGALRAPVWSTDLSDYTIMGRTIYAENALSIDRIYADRHGVRDTARDLAQSYRFALRRNPAPDAVQVLSACAFAEHQCNEHHDFDATWTAGWIERLRRTAIRKLPGYSGAQWGFSYANAA